MIKISDLVFSGFGLLFFVLILIGNFREWKILTDPPDSWTWYSQTILKKIFGQGFLVVYNYFVGTVGMGVMGYIFVVLIIGYFRQR